MPALLNFEHLEDEGKTPGPILDEEKREKGKSFIPMHLIDDNTIDRYVQQIMNRFELRDLTVVIRVAPSSFSSTCLPFQSR